MLLRQHLFFYNATSDTILTMFVFCTVFCGDWGIVWNGVENLVEIQGIPMYNKQVTKM